MTLQARGSDGALLYRASDSALQSECCCGSACNSCTPLLKTEYTLTLSGLTGDLDGLNGAHTVTDDGGAGCSWSFNDADISATLIYNAATPGFQATIGAGSGPTLKCGSVTLDNAGGTCGPTSADAAYSLTSCSAVDCDDTSACTGQTPSLTVA